MYEVVVVVEGGVDVFVVGCVVFVVVWCVEDWG